MCMIFVDDIVLQTRNVLNTPVARFGSVRFLNSRVCFVNGTVRFVLEVYVVALFRVCTNQFKGEGKSKKYFIYTYKFSYVVMLF